MPGAAARAFRSSLSMNSPATHVVGRRSWAFFERHYACTSYNARGYAPSAVPEHQVAYSQMRAAEDLFDVVEATCVAPAHIVGLSMGGFAALHFALRHPDRARSLTIAGCGYGAKPDQTVPYREAMRREADHVEEIGMEAYNEERADAISSRGLKLKDVSAWTLFRAQLSEHSASGTARTLRGVLAERPSLWALEKQFRALDIPTLLVIGDEDTPCIEPSLFLHGVMPDAALCVLPRVGHIVNLEEPAQFNNAVFNFLTAVDAKRWTSTSIHTKSPSSGEKRE